jgi:hypothetical protein
MLIRSIIYDIINNMEKNNLYRICFFLFIIVVFSILLSACSSTARAEVFASDESLGLRRSSENTSDDRMITYSVSLRLSVKNTEETKKTLIEQVNKNDGFIVRESDDYITTRIPYENMESFLSNARTLGKIENETKTGTDITDQYRDDNIRLDILKNVRNRYLTLLERANTVSEIVSVEKELERVNTEIEILEGKIKYSELSVEYSNITVGFREKVKPGPVGWVFYGLYRGIRWLFVWD